MAGTNILVRQKDLIAGSGISITPDTTSSNVTIAATNTAIDESRLLPETGSVSSDSVGNPVIFKAISRIDNTYWLCLPLNEDTNDRSTYDVATEVYGTVNIVSNAPSSPGGSAFFNGSSCLHGTLPAQFGTSDFTVRLWMMAPAISSSSQTIFSTRRGNQTDADTFALLYTTEGRLFIYSSGDITSRTDTPFALQSGVWYHLAVVRKSGVITIYVNGEVYNSATFTNSLTRQIFGLGASWTGSSYSEAGTVYLTSLDVLNYAAYDGAFTVPAYQPGILDGAGYDVATDSEFKDMLSAAGIDESRLIPTGGKDGDILGYQEGADRGNSDNVRLLLQNALTDSANGNVAPAAVTAQGVTLTGDNNLLFDGNDSHVTAVLATDEIFAADKEWTIDFWMKPTANSSEWNYILTENRGDWGSHSIGLTWNKSKSVLEQDTGGYVASVIKAPNWPNNSIACAANEWHFVAVEKQKTATGWSLNYYLNGAIWLQVAFTGEFVPFSSDNPFWFGGKTTDSGRWFKGEANKLRVTAGARYGGKAFAVPDRLTDYAAPAGQPVWTEGIDRSRLLPENPANGDIPCFDATATVGGGNDANTRILLHFDADEIKDEAAGNAAPVTITKKTGTITVVEGGKWGKCAKYVTGSMTVATNLDELNANNWVVSGWFNPDENNHGVSYPTWLSMDDQNTHGFGFDSTGRYGESDGPLFYLDTPPASGTWHWLAIVKYSGGLRFYLNGAFLNEISAQQRANFCSTLAIGGFAGTYAAGSTERTFSGLVDEVRLQYIPDDEITQWTGTSIAVPDAPYSKPQTVGEWGKFNKAELVKSVNGQLPDSSGAVTIPAATASAAGLMTATDKNALDNLRYATQAGAINFNIFSGLNACYILLNGAHTNGPLTGTYSGTLDIISDRTSYVTTQRFTQLTTNKSFIRTYAFDTSTLKGTWSEWSKVIVNTDIATTSAAGLMTATDKVKLDALQQGATYIDTATDFDTYKTTGSYFLKSAAHTNGPLTDSYAGTLVAVGPSLAQYATQYFTQLYTNKTFVRAYSQDNSAWSAWRRIIVDTDLATTTMAGLMPAADKAAIAGLTARGIYPNALAKSGAVDFNEVIDHGFYFIGGDTPHLNYPETYQQTGGTLQVLRYGNYLTQTLIVFDKNKSFNRSCFNALSGSSERTFSAWRRLLIDADITESKARPGYFKLPGGTIVQWGAASNITADGSTQITFPVAFPNAFLIGNATAVSGNASASGVVVSLTAVTVTGMTLIIKNHPGNGNDINVHWLAIGY